MFSARSFAKTDYSDTLLARGKEFVFMLDEEGSAHADGKTFAELTVGDAIEETIVWYPADVEMFSQLTGDVAPVHHDPAFARSMGYDRPILFGMLVAAGFSRLLGCRLPGPLSVFHSLRVEFAAPAYANEPLRYRVEVKQLSPASRTAIVEAKVTRLDGGLVLRGQAQCGYRR